MDLLKILDAKPEPIIIDESHFQISSAYQNSNDYKITTPLSDFQKELIDQIVSLHYLDILKFFERITDGDKQPELNDNKNQIIIDSLNTLLMNTTLVCSHPYLLIDHYFPKSLTTRDMPKRLSETSGKFQIMNDLLTLFDSNFNPRDKNDLDKLNKPIDICIIARSGKTMDLIDALCIGHKCNLKKYSGVKLRESNSSNSNNKTKLINVNIHLIPSDFKNLNNETLPNRPFKLIILFDTSIDDNNYREYLDNLKDNNTKIIRLIPINSVEHISLSYKKNGLSDKDYINKYLKPVTSALVVYRDRVGQLPSELRPIYSKNLIFLDNWINNLYNSGYKNDWPLPDLPLIPEFSSKDVEKSLLTEVKFSFDNQDFIKEELTESSIANDDNKNFDKSKTKMTSHIIQPRLLISNNNNDFLKKDYYNFKRLKKNYLSNPLNLNYELLTGISKDFSKTEILSHTLIYQFNIKFNELMKLNDTFKIFDKYYSIRLRNYKEQMTTFNKINNELENLNEKINGFNSNLIEINEDLVIKKQSINDLKSKIESYLKNYNDLQSKKYRWLLNQSKIIELKEKLNKLEQRLDSNNNESRYMNTELSRASKSIEESNLEIKTKNESIANYSELISKSKHGSNDNNGSVENDELKLITLQYENIQRLNIELQDNLNDMFKKLSDSNNFRSRYVNYSRNGLLSKRKGSPVVK